MFRRRTQNVYSIDNISNNKPKNTGSMGSLKNGQLPQNFQSFEDLEALKKLQIKIEQRRHIDFSDNDYQVYNASGANGRSQFL